MWSGIEARLFATLSQAARRSISSEWASSLPVARKASSRAVWADMPLTHWAISLCSGPFMPAMAAYSASGVTLS